jgi:hypothetical protein
MKSSASAATLLLAALCAYRLGTVVAGTPDRILFDAPRGGWLATLREDAALSVVEERDGWRLVRLEGWMPPQGMEDRAGPAGAPDRVPIGAGAVVRGVLVPYPEWAAGVEVSGRVLLLLSDLDVLDREHSGAGAGCRSRVAASRERADRLRAEADQALNSTDNFREASGRYDRLKQQALAATREGEERLADCFRKADSILQAHAAKRTVSDASGAYEFTGVRPGRYRVVSMARDEKDPWHWSLEFSVAGAEVKLLDPILDRSSFAPRWDLR